MGGAVDDRGVDHLARAGGAGVVEGREQADGEVEGAAGVVAEQVGGDAGRPAGCAADRVEDAGRGDVADVVARAVGEGAVLAPAGHPAVDEGGVAGQAGVGADAEPFGDAGAVALDEQVGPFDEVEHGAGAAGGLEVDEDGPLVAVGEVECGCGAERRRAGAVDPDDVGAEVGEEHGGERAGADPGEFDHAHAGQRALGGLLRHCRPPLFDSEAVTVAMISR